MKRRMHSVLSVLLTLAMVLPAFPISAMARENVVEAVVQDSTVLVQGTVMKTAGDGNETSDYSCDYLSLALYDLSLMGPVTDVTVLKLSSEQKKADQVEFQARLEVVSGNTIQAGEEGRYVLMGSFEKTANFLSSQMSGSQFSIKLLFKDSLQIDAPAEGTTVQINRPGYIARDDASLKNGPNDNTPAVGDDGLWLKPPKGTEVLVIYKGDYTYRIEYLGKQYYTAIENITFEGAGDHEDLAETIRRMIYQQSMLKDFYMYGIPDNQLEEIVGSGELGDAIHVTREQLMNGAESVEEALKAYLKNAKKDGVSSDQLVAPYVDAAIEEDPMEIIGQAANDLFSEGRTEAIREREEELEAQEGGNSQENIDAYEEEHAGDSVKIEIDKDVVGELLGKVWDTQLADEVINAPADTFGTQIVNIYKEILGWDNRMPKNYKTLMECYTGTPGGLSSFRAEGGINLGNEYADVKGSISQNEKVYEYGSRMSGKFRGYIQSGQLSKLPYAYQTQEVSAYNRFLPGSLVVMEVWDFRVFSTSKKQYLGVYAGNGVFYLPGFEDSAFDTLMNLDGIERSDGMIKITQNGTTRPFNKNAYYGFLGFCVRNISITNVYEPDLSLFTDPKYSRLDDTYFPSMSAARMSQIRYNEVQWQVDNRWRAPKVWDD